MHIVRRIVAVFLVTTLLVCLGGVVQASDFDVPDTRAGEIVTKFVEAFNSGDSAQWKAFIETYWKPSEQAGATERRLGYFAMISGDLGPIEPVEVTNAEDYSITWLARGTQPTSDFEWVEFSFLLDTLPPHQIVRASARPGEDPKYEVPQGPLSDDDIVAFLKWYLDELAAADKFSGAVLLARDGEPIFKQAYGEASKRWHAPNRIDTKFNLGSMNKMFTGVAIAQLAEQGKLAFTDTVGQYLPDCPRKEIAEKVTIHQLLTHTSGMQDYWEEIFNAKWWEIKTVGQLAALIYDDSLLFEPGTDFHYSNSGPVVLGQIIEKVSGEDYYDYVREHIAKPAGMMNTDCYEVDTPVPNLAIGYTHETYTPEEPRPDHWRNNLFMHPSKGCPAGGGYSTVEDLLRFAQALQDGTILSKAYVDTVTTGKVDMGPPGMRYGYLFGDEDNDGLHVVGHSGGAPGINAKLSMYVDLGYTAAVMANYDMAASTVANKIDELIRARQSPR